MENQQSSSAQWKYVIVALLGLVFILALFFPMTWRPWLSPQYAAKALVEDDGKGPVFWTPNAARFWGPKTYGYIYEYTDQFDNLNRNPLIFTLLDILSADRTKSRIAISEKLLDSNNTKANLLGCYVAVSESLALPGSASCRAKIRNVLSQDPDIYNQTEIQTALRVAGRSKMRGVSEELTRLMSNKTAPYGVHLEACHAAASIEEQKLLEAFKSNCNDAAGRTD